MSPFADSNLVTCFELVQSKSECDSSARHTVWLTCTTVFFNTGGDHAKVCSEVVDVYTITERQRQRQTDRQTETETQRHRKRHTETSETKTQTHRETETQRQTETETNRQTLYLCVSALPHST